jgi:hypothetical protein
MHTLSICLCHLVGELCLSVFCYVVPQSAPLPGVIFPPPPSPILVLRIMLAVPAPAVTFSTGCQEDQEEEGGHTEDEPEEAEDVNILQTVSICLVAFFFEFWLVTHFS